MANRDLSPLVKIFEEASEAVQRPGTDFRRCSVWNDVTDAVAEIAPMLAELRSGSVPDKLGMKVLFAPTGDLQEVSIGNGWSDEYMSLASRFDSEIARIGA